MIMVKFNLFIFFVILFIITPSFAKSKSIHKFTNRLINETSPYLLQHAHNPVDWYPWGEEALNIAKKENKPIFLSIGYSACHWCHVMEHESFEDEETASLLKQHFISIKVDREERPDLDDIYMAAVQAMTGSGGWPMTVFLTPEKKPFFAGTYFPKDNQYGRPGFKTVIQHFGKLWKEDRQKVILQGNAVTKHLEKQLEESLPPSPLPKDFLITALDQLEKNFDHHEGGFGSAPKFPSSMALDLYIEYLQRHPNSKNISTIKDHLKLSLRKMAQGGVYDQIGGGFHRYSTDGKWLVPHFEKMLYDNALLARTYFEASKFIDRDFNLRIGKEICDYILKEMTHKNGAFYSTTDADSEGMEGKFFLWSNHEIIEALGEKDGKLFCKIFEIDSEPIGSTSFHGGTPPHEWFHGRIPHLENDLEDIIKKHKISLEKIKQWKQILWNAREKKVHPGLDDKVLSSWNGLMSTGFATAYRFTLDETYLSAAKNNLEFIWQHMQKNGRLYATWRNGKAKHFGTLEDYSNIIMAHLALHRVCSKPIYLERAKQLTDQVILHFKDKKGKAFFYTADDAEALIVRSKNPYDNAVPAGNSILAENLVTLGILLQDPKYTEWAQGIFEEYSTYLSKSVQSFARLARAYVQLSYGIQEWVLLGATQNLQQQVLQHMQIGDLYLTEENENLKLLQDKKSSGQAILYLCLQGMCKKPIEGEKEILNYLKTLP